MSCACVSYRKSQSYAVPETNVYHHIKNDRLDASNNPITKEAALAQNE